MRVATLVKELWGIRNVVYDDLDTYTLVDCVLGKYVDGANGVVSVVAVGNLSWAISRVVPYLLRVVGPVENCDWERVDIVEDTGLVDELEVFEVTVTYFDVEPALTTEYKVVDSTIPGSVEYGLAVDIDKVDAGDCEVVRSGVIVGFNRPDPVLDSMMDLVECISVEGVRLNGVGFKSGRNGMCLWSISVWLV